MQQITHPKLIVIYGPTVTGKTDLALKIAKKFNGEIISADSRQVYEDLDIGTGKTNAKANVTKHKRYWIVNGVKIHGFDLIKPGGKFTVADFLKFASGSIIEITESQKLPIVAGGTGFYIKSLLYGLESVGIQKDEKLRKELNLLSVDDIFQMLKEINPQKAKSLNESDKKNPRRLIRAIEISKVGHEQKTTKYISPAVEYFFIGLSAPNEFLYKKADKWLEERLNQGLIEEVKNLLEKVNPEWLISLGLEYKWSTLFLKGKISKEEAISRLKGDIHDFVRRQKTWFRQFKEIKIYDITDKLEMELLEKTVSLWYTQENERLQRSSKN